MRESPGRNGVGVGGAAAVGLWFRKRVTACKSIRYESSAISDRMKRLHVYAIPLLVVLVVSLAATMRLLEVPVGNSMATDTSARSDVVQRSKVSPAEAAAISQKVSLPLLP